MLGYARYNGEQVQLREVCGDEVLIVAYETGPKWILIKELDYIDPMILMKLEEEI